MAKRCQICGRKAKKSYSRSHSNIASKRRQFLNLQTKTIEGARIKICTTCLKTREKVR